MTAPPPGPVATVLASTWHSPCAQVIGSLLFAMPARAIGTSAVAAAAASMAMIQARMVRNLVHSARSTCAKPSCAARWPERYGVIVAAITPPAQPVWRGIRRHRR